MFVGGTGLRWFVLAGVGGAGAIGAAIVIMPDLVPYAASRLSSWLDPFADPLGDGHQTIQSLYAIGSGGAAGLGLGNSRQKHLFVPEPQNDFIFSILCEELGFVGACAVILLFSLLLLRGVTLAAHAPDRFGALLVVGFVVQVALQAVLNIAVVTNTIPNTGISLPFFSSGGTSLMMLLGEMGIVLPSPAGKHKGGHFCRKMGCLPRKRRKKQTNDRTNAFCGVRVQNREPTALVLHTMGYLWQNGGLCMAGDYIIMGGRPLNGTVWVPAAKNSVLPLLAASLLCSGPVRLCGVPELADVAESLALLRSAGCTAERQGADVRVDGVPGSGTRGCTRGHGT